MLRGTRVIMGEEARVMSQTISDLRGLVHQCGL